MEIPNGGEIPAEAALIFHVSGGKTLPPPPRTQCDRIDAEGLKCDDDGISATCIDFFEGKPGERFIVAAFAMRGTMKFRKSGVIATVTVGEILAAVEGEQADVRVVRDILPSNPGHCLIKGVAADNVPLRMLIAGAVNKFTPVTDLPGLVNG